MAKTATAKKDELFPLAKEGSSASRAALEAALRVFVEGKRTVEHRGDEWVVLLRVGRGDEDARVIGVHSAQPAARAQARRPELPPAGAPLAELVDLVRDQLEPALAATPDDQQLVCPECGELGTDWTEFCPYCGNLGEGAEPVPAPPSALAARDPEAAVRELDAAVAKFRQLAKDLAGNTYDLGVEVRRIHDAELWKARGHASFKAFVESELGISSRTAYVLADTTRQFDRDVFQRVGSEKLRLIASVQDEAAKAQLVEAAESGASKRQIAEAAASAKQAQERERGGAVERQPKARPALEAVPPPPPEEPAPIGSGEQKVTVLAKLDGEPVMLAWRSSKTGEELEEYQRGAYAELQLGRDVVLRLQVRAGKGGANLGLVAKFEKVRPE